MTIDSDDNREQGIEFGDLGDDLEDADYPISHDELLSRYGDRELDLQKGEKTLREVVGEEQEREYQDAEGVRDAVFSMVGDDAVGREGYSDRGGTSGTETNDTEDSI